MMSHANNVPDASDTVVGFDWSPERQTAQLLDLCEAQMEAALQESDAAVDALVQAFTSMADTARSLDDLRRKLPPSEERRELTDISQHCEQMTRQMASAIVAFQFYDKLTQRLGHVRYSLSTLAMFVCDPQQTAQRDQWRKLLVSLRRLYRTEEEKAIFHLVSNGLPAEEARIIAAETRSGTPTGGSDIELF